MNRILLPTDFSQNAWNAISYALTLFKGVPCHFIILNAFQVGSSGLMTKMGRANQTRLFQLLQEESEHNLKKVQEKVKSVDSDPDHTFETLSMVGNLTGAVGKTVLDERVDCIVMGTKGATGLKEIFLGSNAYKIIKHINFCPVVLVPEHWEYTAQKPDILFVTGYEHIFESYEFKPLLDLAKLLKGKVLVGHMGLHSELEPEQQNAKNVVQKYLQDGSFQFVEIQEKTFVNTAIQNTVAENDTIGMIAMIDYWHTFFEKITDEPVIKKVAFNTQVPFLVIHLVE